MARSSLYDITFGQMQEFMRKLAEAGFEDDDVDTMVRDLDFNDAIHTFYAAFRGSVKNSFKVPVNYRKSLDQLVSDITCDWCEVKKPYQALYQPPVPAAVTQRVKFALIPRRLSVEATLEHMKTRAMRPATPHELVQFAEHLRPDHRVVALTPLKGEELDGCFLCAERRLREPKTMDYYVQHEDYFENTDGTLSFLAVRIKR